MSIAAYQQMRAPTSRWRRRARVAILEVLHRVTASTSTAEVISLVDAAYPFGEREMHPYKMWLAERRTLIDALGASERPLPDRGDADICEVASDAVEDGRIEFAVSLMNEQAPNRLNRKCPACGAAVGQPCHDEAPPETVANDWRGDYQGAPRYVYQRRQPIERIVPHVSRLVVDSGPLFGART